MTTLIKIIITTLLSLTLFSCNFDLNFQPGIPGNGNVVEETRDVTASFNTIRTSEGLNVYLTQASNETITVEADENIQGLILTEIKDGVLKIHTKERIGKASAKKIYVSIKDVSKITSSSGSNVYSNSSISAEYLNLQSSSGSNMNLEVNTNQLTCNASSGSNLKVSGSTLKLNANASSGSNIKAGDLIAESSQVKASSGANLTVNTSKELMANASSGAGIRYYGNPEKVDKNKSSGGSIKQK